jgi:hypothetical protein
MFAKLRSLGRITSDCPAAPTPTDEAKSVASLRDSLSTFGPLTPEQSVWLDDACLLRYLRARGFEQCKAMAMLRDTLTWRQTNAIHELVPAKQNLAAFDIVSREAATGKMFVLPKLDSLGRAVIVMRPGLENSEDVDGNILFLKYTLERASRLCPAAGKFALIIDYSAGEFSIRNAPSLSTNKLTLSIVQDHFPERLALAVMVDPPSFFYPLFCVVRPFIDPITAAKINFVTMADDATNPVNSGLLDASTTPAEYGGELHYRFDAESYFELEV